MKEVLILASAGAGLLVLFGWSRRPEAEESVEVRSLATSVALLRIARYDRERVERMLRYFAAWETGWRTTTDTRHVEQIRKVKVA